MKKIFTQLFLCLFVFSAAHAQIPNPSFESWTTDANGTHPVSWVTSDQLSMQYASVHSAEQDGLEKCDSLFSIKLTSFLATIISQNVPGVATNGIINGANVTNVSGGSPYTQRSAQFAGCYKYAPAGSDSGRISCVLTKWNGVKRDTIALALLNTHPSGGLINFAIDFIYFSASNPDTALALFVSGQGIGATNAGSIMIVDNVHFVGTIGINEISQLNDVDIFPQPAQNELNIRIGSRYDASYKYEIADITGRKVLTGKMESANQKVNISLLSRGNYFVSIHNREGAILYSSKFVVTK